MQAGGDLELGRWTQSIVDARSAGAVFATSRLCLSGQVGLLRRLPCSVNAWGCSARRRPWLPMGLTPMSPPAGEDRFGRRVITFSCCRMPPSHELNHRRLLE